MALPQRSGLKATALNCSLFYLGTSGTLSGTSVVHSLCFKTQKATDCDVYSGSISPGYWPLSGEKRGEKQSEEETETERESEQDGEGNSEIAVLNALETQRKKEYNGLSGLVLVWFTLSPSPSTLKIGAETILAYLSH